MSDNTANGATPPNSTNDEHHHLHHQRRDHDYDNDSEHYARKRSRHSRSRSRSRERDTMSQSEYERRKQAENDCTVFVCNLAATVDERMLFDFFQQRLGPVVDHARIIRDRISGRSKGFAFVQFTEESAVERAVLCSNTPLEGRSILVRRSEADRPAGSRTPGASSNLDLSDDITRLLFKPTPDALQIEDFKDLFSSIGRVEDIEFAVDEHGKRKGFGYVTYESGADAKRALVKFNSLNLGFGIVLRMGMWNEQRAVMFDQQLAAIMPGMSPQQGWSTPGSTTQPQQQTPPGIETPAPGTATRSILLANMFDPNAEQEPDFDKDIEMDVVDECEENFGRVKHIFVDKDSAAGNVYLRFEDTAAAQRAQQALHMRWFGGRQVTAMFVTDESYLTKFPELTTTAPTSSSPASSPTTQSQLEQQQQQQQEQKDPSIDRALSQPPHSEPVSQEQQQQQQG